MVSETNLEAMSQTTAIAGWEPPMPPTDLIFDDGEPLETNRHRNAMNVLINSIHQAYCDRNDFFAGGNMFIYYSSAQARNRDFRGPDFFVVLNIDGSYPRQGWVVWEENGRYPDVIVELMSPSTADMDTGAKKDLYEQVFRTRDYFVFNPFNPDSLQGWSLDAADRYQPLTSNEQGWLWSETLGLWLGTWSGTLYREPAVWLRFYDEAGNLVPLPEEAAQQQGLRQGALRQLLRLLTTRFETVPPEVQSSLQALDVHQLEDLVELALSVNSLEQFVNHLSFEESRGERFVLSEEEFWKFRHWLRNSLEILGRVGQPRSAAFEAGYKGELGESLNLVYEGDAGIQLTETDLTAASYVLLRIKGWDSGAQPVFDDTQRTNYRGDWQQVLAHLRMNH